MESLRLLFCFGFLALMGGCSSAYYGFWETFGKEKRELLQSNLEAANEDQEEVKERFESTIERIKSEYGFEGGELEATYRGLKDDYEDASSSAEDLSERVKKVEEIGEDLFEEWKNEARNFNNRSYRKDSLAKLAVTKKRFYLLLDRLKNVEGGLQKTLKSFEDKVVYLKHNLNAKAIGSFKAEFKSIEREMGRLVKEINASSVQAEAFINDL